MAHITLSVPDELYDEMKKHPEVKWTEIARTAIADYLNQLQGTSNSKEILALLPLESRLKLKSLTEREAAKFFGKVVEKEWTRLRSLTQTS